MSLQARTQALLELVEADRRSHCEAIVAEARAQAAALLAQARSEARARVKLAFAEERARAEGIVAAARADLQTRRRLHAQRRVEALLALAWQHLPAALEARWRDGRARQRWIDTALMRAAAVLPHTRWQVAHGEQGWTADERRALEARLGAASGTPPQFTVDPRIAAGLRIGAAGDAVDATLAGLLADRDEIGGRLIAELEHLG